MDNPRRKELRAVLAGDPALMALLAAARDRYAQSGSWTTKTIALATPELRDAVKALGITNARDRLPMKTLGDVLGRTRFRCTVEEAVHWAFDDIPATRDERQAAARLLWEARRAEMISLAGRAIEEVTAWLDARPALLRRDWADPALHEAGRLAVCAAAMTKNLATPELVPVLANRLCGDPHALDVGRPARRYLERILLCRHSDLGFHAPMRAADRAALLATSNLAADGISSQVWVIGLVSADPMLVEARRSAHVIGLPLITINSIAEVAAHDSTAFAVENRSVFGALVPIVAAIPLDRRPTLICTSGNPSLAARLLLRRLAQCGTTIYYGGDGDARGRAIAQTIATLVGQGYRSWHMQAFDESERHVRYQESFLGEMIADLRREALDHHGSVAAS